MKNLIIKKQETTGGNKRYNVQLGNEVIDTCISRNDYVAASVLFSRANGYEVTYHVQFENIGKGSLIEPKLNRLGYSFDVAYLNNEKNFELTTESKINSYGFRLYRIRCTREIPGVKVGDLGGWIRKKENIAGFAWVSGDAEVFGDALVSGCARVSGNARVFGRSLVTDNVEVSGRAEVLAQATISGNAKVYGSATVSGRVIVSGNSKVFDKALVSADAEICDDAKAFGNSWVAGTAKLLGNDEAQGETCIFGQGFN